jgi:hypothetical protein|tara:strand:+ start:34 stop:498 length:465 start_codon:yes stop_codon:yes gene_type:complete
MPKITRYVQDSEVTATDKILGTDSSGATKNYTLQSIANHVKSPSFVTVTKAEAGGTTTHTCNLTLNDNFSINAVNGPNVIAVNIEDSNIGQSGNIIITNPSSVTSLAFAELGSNFKTPSGATINFDLTADKIAIISYIVLTTDSILVNYIGDFS